MWGVSVWGWCRMGAKSAGRCGSKGGRGWGGREGEVEEEGGSWHCFWHLCFSDTRSALILLFPTPHPSHASIADIDKQC